MNAMNLPTAIILLLAAAAVFFALRFSHRQRRKKDACSACSVADCSLRQIRQKPSACDSHDRVDVLDSVGRDADGQESVL